MQRDSWSRWDTWLLGGWILAFAVARGGRLQDTDPYWQVVAGREVLQGSPLARPDTWSWAPVDGLFYPNSPAWNVLLAHGWDLAGSWGMFVLAAATIAAYLTVVAYLARRLGAGPLATIGAIIVTSLMVLPMLSPRATMAAQLLLMTAIAFAVTWASRASRHGTFLNAVVVGVAGLALSVTGNWVHLSWATLAVAVAVAWAVLWILWPGLARASRVVMTVTGTFGLVAGIALGPYGMEVFGRSQTVLEVCRGLILEWTSAVNPDLAARWVLPAVGVVLLSGWAAAWCLTTAHTTRRRDPRLAIAASLTVLALPTALAGIAAIRFIGVSALTIAPMTALAISVAMNRLHSRYTTPPSTGRSRRAEYTGATAWRTILTMLLIVLAPFTVWYAWPHSEPATAEATRLLPAGCRLFAQSNESAAVILLRPDVPVWLDGRADYWGRARLEQMNRIILDVDPADPVPEGTTCVLLPPAASNPEIAVLTAALDNSPDWVRSATTDTATVWVPR